MISLASSGSFRWLASQATHPTASFPGLQHLQRRFRHVVRVIAIEDLPHEKGYKGDVLQVKAGYARNFLIPQKLVLYATRANFNRLGMKDPEYQTLREKRARFVRDQQLSQGDSNKRAADVLRKYLSNKMLTIYRQMDDDKVEVNLDRKGVDPLVLKTKLSKHLKIDLEHHERVCIQEKPIESSFEEMESQDDHKTKLSEMMKEMGDKDVESPEVRRLGYYYARIWLEGDHLVPLKFKLERRWGTKKARAS